MKKNILIALLGLFVLYDICRSFDQHLHMPLDGDLALIVLPADCFKAAMKDPLGIQASVNGKVYHASNRAFAHWTMSLYFKTVPFFFSYLVHLLIVFICRQPWQKLFFSC